MRPHSLLWRIFLAQFHLSDPVQSFLDVLMTVVGGGLFLTYFFNVYGKIFAGSPITFVSYQSHPRVGLPVDRQGKSFVQCL